VKRKPLESITPSRRPDMASHFELHSTVAGARFRREFLLTCVNLAARRMRGRIGRINLVVVGDREMARLHRTYMNVSGTTDVLTFDLSESGARFIDGDIYICLDQARRQAHDYRVPLYHEMARLAVHGILHLAGYSDATDEQRAHMRSLEDRTLKAIGEQRS
jgi:probable rRNA maturation factor